MSAAASLYFPIDIAAAVGLPFRTFCWFKDRWALATVTHVCHQLFFSFEAFKS